MLQPVCVAKSLETSIKRMAGRSRLHEGVCLILSRLCARVRRKAYIHLLKIKKPVVTCISIVTTVLFYRCILSQVTFKVPQGYTHISICFAYVLFKYFSYIKKTRTNYKHVISVLEDAIPKLRNLWCVCVCVRACACVCVCSARET